MNDELDTMTVLKQQYKEFCLDQMSEHYSPIKTKTYTSVAILPKKIILKTFSYSYNFQIGKKNIFICYDFLKTISWMTLNNSILPA